MSSSEYWVPGGEQYYHILTNTGGVEGSWNTAELPNGRYHITVEVSDFAGNEAARSMFVTVRQPGTTLDLTQPGYGDVYMKDRANDFAAPERR